MVKTNKKSLVALIVMAFLLVASIVMAATGAWFTDSIAQQSGKLDFGKVDLTDGTLTLTADHDLVVPGCTVTVDGDIVYGGTVDAYVAYKLSLVFEVDVNLTDLTDGYTYDASTKTLSTEVVYKVTVADSTNVTKAMDTTFIIPTTLTEGQGSEANWTLDIAACQADHVAVPTTFAQVATPTAA